MNCKQASAKVLPLLMIATVVAGCATDDCESNHNTLPLAGFYSSAISPQAISLDSITVFGVGAPGDSLLVDNSSNVSEVYLPFKLDGGETTFTIQYNQESMRGAADHIRFTYDAQPFFVSAACGVSYRFNIKEIDCTHVAIDSVSVPGMVIDNTNTQNIRIYFRVNTE